MSVPAAVKWNLKVKGSFSVPFVIISGADTTILKAAEALARQYELPLLASFAKPLDFAELAEIAPLCR